MKSAASALPKGALRQGPTPANRVADHSGGWCWAPGSMATFDGSVVRKAVLWDPHAQPACLALLAGETEGSSGE